jgi:hypothetical protein
MMRIVANNSRGLFSNTTMFFSDTSSDSLQRSKSFAFNEKNATSEAEIIADKKSSTAMAAKLKT